MTIPAEAIARARKVPIMGELSRRKIDLRRVGQELIGPCPRCGGDDRFAVSLTDNVWNCRGCKPPETTGDAIGFVQWLDGSTFQDAVERLIGPIGANGGAYEKTNGKSNGYNKDGHSRTSPHSREPLKFQDTRSRKIIATYDYADEFGQLRFQVCRTDPKGFFQRRPGVDGGWINNTDGVQLYPYRLPDLIAAIGMERTVYIVEGEKDADLLAALGIPATCNARGAGKWTADLAPWFHDADVVIIPDFDPPATGPKGELRRKPDGSPVLPGQDHALAVAAALQGTASRVRVLDLGQVWPECPAKGDIGDWVALGRTAEAFYALAEGAADWSPDMVLLFPEPEAEIIVLVDAFPIDGKRLPRRPWEVPGLFLRGQVTLLVAPPGSGKSLLTLQIAIMCARGQPWSGWSPRGKYRTMVVNVEEDTDEMRRRLFGSVQAMKIDQEELIGQILLAEQTESIVVAQADSRTHTVTATPMIKKIIATIQKHKIDIVIVDPFAETFSGDENNNSQLKWAAVLWREVARKTNCAVLLVHHAKKYSSGMAGDMDAARGGGSLAGVARFVGTLFAMTEKEHEQMQPVDKSGKEIERTRLLRYDDAKANVSLISSTAKWFFKDTVSVGNGTDGEPDDDVGVLIPWRPPDAFEDLEHVTVNRILDEIAAGMRGDDGQPIGDPYGASNKGGGKRWVGRLIQNECPSYDRKKASKLISLMLKSGVLVEYDAQTSSSNRKKVACLKVDDSKRPPGGSAGA